MGCDAVRKHWYGNTGECLHTSQQSPHLGDFFPRRAHELKVLALLRHGTAHIRGKAFFVRKKPPADEHEDSYGQWGLYMCDIHVSVVLLKSWHFLTGYLLVQLSIWEGEVFPKRIHRRMKNTESMCTLCKSSLIC